MPDVNNADNSDVVDNDGQGKPIADAFGNEPVKAPEEKVVKDEANKYEAIPVDHPIIKSLQDQVTKLSEDKGSMGTNLSKQGDIIKGMEKTIADLKAGKIDTKGGDVDALFKDIKFSKDLTDEEREDMTDTEIKQMDIIADMQTKQNEFYSESLSKEKVEKEKVEKEKVVEDKNATVRSIALEITKGEDGSEDKEMANKVIESFKFLGFNLEGKTAEEIKKLVEISAKEVPDYKPSKEQTQKNTKTVKNSKTVEDPFGNDAIISEATKSSDGEYTL